MNAPIHILATCRSEELLPATLLVFKSLRVGFPTAKVHCSIQGLPEGHPNGWPLGQIADACKGAGVGHEILEGELHHHHEWITRLIHGNDEPFWICDTDMIFWNSFEVYDFSNQTLAGWYIPEFFCKFANAVTRPRLHTSLLYIDPVGVRSAIKRYAEQFPDAYCTPRPGVQDLVFPRYIPMREGRKRVTIFHDTCSLLYQAIAGTHFLESQLDRYSHLNSGTISDLVAKAYPDQRLRESHFAIFENPEMARGCWRQQEQFYKDNKA